MFGLPTLDSHSNYKICAGEVAGSSIMAIVALAALFTLTVKAILKTLQYEKLIASESILT